MQYRLSIWMLTVVVAGLVGCSGPADEAENGGDNQQQQEELDPVSLRVATFNTSLYREQEGQLIDDLSDPDHLQARQIAEIIQINRPDIILLNEFDYDADVQGATLFADNFLSQPQGDQEGLDYPYFYAVPSNTGVPSGVDLNGDGESEGEVGTEEYAQNAYGYGIFPGQYAFVIFSKYPLLIEERRSFQHFLWDQMPHSLMPRDYYSAEAIEIFRLSSKNHVDIPVDVEGRRLHILASHPTPPAFDGPEQRNVRRNADEIRLWTDYLDGVDYLVDDQGASGGLDEEAYFVIVGDLNADPNDSDEGGAMADLLAHPRTTDPMPESDGGQISGESRGGRNDVHEGEHRHDTSQWHPNVGNMRVDYAIPSSNLQIDDSAVFWPAPDQPHADLVEATDHRLVWVDVTL